MKYAYQTTMLPHPTNVARFYWQVPTSKLRRSFRHVENFRNQYLLFNHDVRYDLILHCDSMYNYFTSL